MTAVPPVGPTTVAGRLRWAALVVGVLVVVGIAAGVLAGADDGGGEGGDVAADAGVPIRDVRLYDPYGAVDRTPGQLLGVVDGDPTTGWTTPAYPRPLRVLGFPGVGVRIETDDPVTIAEVTLDLAIEGVTVEVLTREDRPPPASTELDWVVVGREADAGSTAVLTVEQRRGRHWLVWFTSLADVGDAWQAALTDVQLRPVDEP